MKMFYEWQDGECELRCPVCGFECTHIQQVVLAARREDQDPTWIVVDVVTGQVATIPPGFGAPPPIPHELGRRHAQYLLGACENGCSFWVGFQQHKGATLVEGGELGREALRRIDGLGVAIET